MDIDDKNSIIDKIESLQSDIKDIDSDLIELKDLVEEIEVEE